MRPPNRKVSAGADLEEALTFGQLPPPPPAQGA